MSEFLEIISPGGGVTVQDLGRPGWKRFGVPAGGAMDLESARLANRLVGNGDSAAVLEFLFTGARLELLEEVEIAITGAAVRSGNAPRRNFTGKAGEEILFSELHSGVWSYLAVRGGFDAPRWFGSASVYARAGLGMALQKGMKLSRMEVPEAKAIAGRFVPKAILPHFEEVPTIGVFKGPEWALFSTGVQAVFLEQTWTISQQSDRTGYRLEGAPLPSHTTQILSAPLSVGTVQVPPGGQPIVILRDGPTVGGYPRLAILNADEVSRFTQCAPGTQTRFRLIE